MPQWVFCNVNGGLIDPDHLRNRVFYGLLKAAGLRRLRFHDLRHTFASLLLQQGESPVYVKEQMGHSSIQVTVDLYGHLIPGGNKQAVDRLDSTQSEVSNATPAQPADSGEWRESAKVLRMLVRPAGLEPAACGFEARRSIQLSYGRIVLA
jgi:hypothetical protein